MPASSIALLTVQALLAVVGLRVLVRRVLPLIAADPSPAVVSDVWAPMIVVLPFLVAAGDVGESVRPTGWTAVGAPAWVGVFAVAAVLLVGPPRPRAGVDPGLPLACGGAGMLLLMLGAAHDLTVWIGQCTFALAAVLLWLNTPTSAAEAETRAPERGGDGAGAAWVPVALLCAAGQGACRVLVADGAAAAVSSAVMVASAAWAMVGAAAISRGGDPALRIGGWSAALGTLFGIGIISVAHMTPLAVRIIAGQTPEVSTRVAYGFGAFAAEGAILLLVGAAVATAQRVPTPARRALGAVLGVVAAAVVAWRLSSM
ncbi:MAG: hypothetical protein GY715_08035 [Planctomycetes bacterium]|nr:hypothetical protein [Planctomycetota bacterium]